MSISSKLARYVFLLLLVFTYLSPVTVHGQPSEATDHFQHTQAADSVVENNQNDCVSACMQNSRAENAAVILKETTRKREKYPQPEPDKEGSHRNQPVNLVAAKSYVLPTQQIYKLTCCYLS